MSRHISGLWAVIFMALFILGNSKEVAGNLMGKINENRVHLLQLAQSLPVLTEQRENLIIILQQPLPEAIPVSEQEILIHAIFNLGRYPSGYNNDTGFIEDEAVLTILIEALGGEVPEIRRFAFRYLLEYARVDQLAFYSEAVKPALNIFNQPQGIRLLALLTLTAEKKAELLKQENLRIDVRARLGDTSAEEVLINRFLTADQYREKAELAAMLGYTGTPSCAKNLIKALHSPLLSEGLYERISIRYEIIKALGKIHPAEPLLTKELARIRRLGDDKYGPDNLQNYLNDGRAWAEATYGVSPEGPVPAPILYKKIIVMYPLK